MKQPLKLEPTRWKGGPKICPHYNLPAHATEKAAKDFVENQCPGMKLVFVWQCPHCLFWHHEATGPDPTGGSSGTGRSGFYQSKYGVWDEAQKKMVLKV